MKKHKELSTIALLEGMLTNKDFVVVWKVTPHNAFTAYLAQNTLDCLHVIKQFKKDGWTVTAGNRGFYFACERIRELEHLLLHRGIITNKTVFPMPSVFEMDGLGVPRPVENVFTPQTLLQSFLHDCVNFNTASHDSFTSIENLYKCYCNYVNSECFSTSKNLIEFKMDIVAETPKMKSFYCQYRPSSQQEAQWGFRYLSLTEEGERLLKGATK